MNTCVICSGPVITKAKTCSGKCKVALQALSIPAKKCPFPECEESFTSGSPRKIYCSPKHDVICFTCDGPATVLSAVRAPFSCKTCSKIATSKKRAQANRDKTPEEKEKIKEKTEQTNLERYGVRRPLMKDSFKEKSTETNKARYNTSHPMQNKEIRKKAEQTNLERYGTKHAAQNENVKEKTKITNLKRYGAEHPTMTDATQAKMKKTMLENYGVENPSQDHGIREKSFKKYGGISPMASHEIREKVRDTLMERYGVRNPALIPEVQERMRLTMFERINAGDYTHPRVSKLNRGFAKELEIIYKKPVLFEVPYGKYAADLMIEGMLIELNPTISHNTQISFPCFIAQCEIPCAKHSLPPAKNYHFEKAQTAKAEGRRLIQFYDWDSPKEVMALLAGKLDRTYQKFSARKLSVVELTAKQASAFMDDNHFQGGVNGQVASWGLTNSDELLAVTSFSKARFGAKEEWEFLRYAVKRGVIVHGASSKLWGTFIANKAPSSVISYIDYNHTTLPQTFLNTLGFSEIRPPGANLTWHNMRTNKKINESSLLKIGADRALKTNYGSREKSGLNNHDIMILEGYLPVYTAGNRIFKWFKD